jgi:CheY-like chemotaxis protein
MERADHAREALTSVTDSTRRGTMWAESEPGKGSAFHFSVRAAPAVGAAPRPVAAELRGKRLLIVDDNAANREAVASHARSWGMVPRDTGSPAQALGWIRRGDPLDVAILDMQMPEMDGLTLACEIRRWLDRDALPLVISPRLGRRLEDDEARSKLQPSLRSRSMRRSCTTPSRLSWVHRPPAAAPTLERDRLAAAAELRILLGEDTRSTGGRPSGCWRSLAPAPKSS